MQTGEIWLVNCSPSVGSEIAKTRPAVVVSNSEMGGLGLHIVLPITDAKKIARDWHIRINPSDMNGLRKPSLVDCFQIHSFSESRFQKRIGRLSTKDMDSIKVCLAEVLDLL